MNVDFYHNCHNFQGSLNCLDTEDTYNTVILKQINAFHWVLTAYAQWQNVSKLKWVIKMDDDVVVSPTNLQNILDDNVQNAEKEVILCREMAGRPIRSPDNKW